ncbi:MAG: SPFH domain-containing protein [Candidatus Kerfeldbacteria bacterium]
MSKYKLPDLPKGKPKKEEINKTTGDNKTTWDKVLVNSLVISFLWTVFGFFVCVFIATENHLARELFTTIGLIFWMPTAVLYFFLGTRPQDDIVEGYKDQLRTEENYLKKRIKEHSGLLAVLESEMLILKKMRLQDKVDRNVITTQEQLVADKKKKADRFYNQIIEPCKKNGGIIPPANEFGDIVAVSEDYKSVKNEGVDQIKKKIVKFEKDLVRKYSMPMVTSFVFFIIFFFSRLAMIPDSDGYILTYLIILGMVLIRVLFTCSEDIGEDVQAIKFFLGRAYMIVFRGRRLRIPFLMKFIKFPTIRQFFNVPIDKAWLTGDEPQTVESDTTVVWWIEKPLDVITNLGRDFEKIKEKLEGKLEGDSKHKGMISASAGDAIRSFMADPNKIPDLMEALRSRDPLSELIITTLTKDIGYMGIGFEMSKIPDINPEKDVADQIKQEAAAKRAIKANEQLAKALVAKAVGEKKAAIEAAEGKAKSTILTGEADADARLKMGEADVKVIKITLETQIEAISSLEDKESAKAVLPFIYALLLGEKSVPEVAKALQGLNLNIWAIPEIKNILGPLAGLFHGFGKSEK